MGKLKLYSCSVLLLGALLIACSGSVESPISDEGQEVSDIAPETVDQPETPADDGAQNGPEIAEENPDQAGPEDIDGEGPFWKICEKQPWLCHGLEEEGPEHPGEQLEDGRQFKLRF